PGDRRLGAVELFDALAPFGAVEPLGRLPRLPEITAAHDAPVLGADVIFPDQPRKLLIFRRGRLETPRGLGKRDRRWELELHQGGDHDCTSEQSLSRPRPLAASRRFRRNYGPAGLMGSRDR